LASPVKGIDRTTQKPRARIKEVLGGLGFDIVFAYTA